MYINGSLTGAVGYPKNNAKLIVKTITKKQRETVVLPFAF